MYDELVKRLRKEAVYLPEKFSTNAELLDVLMKAADAIEELQKRVPKTPHGRLIDADVFETAMFNDPYQDFVHILAQLPTIIPAEEAET